MKEDTFLDISLFDNILLSPLDWGLGHTTRCFPIIENLLSLNKNVFIACEKGFASEKILQQSFPDCTYLHLDGYNIHYGKNKNSFNVAIAAQIPKILSSIKNENKILQKWIDEYKIQLVISDNRYGLYSHSIPCIFITHQLQIKLPFASLEKTLQKINYKYINKFTECWVPDFEDTQHNIAGDLSHPEKMPDVPVKYIGPLSRLKKIAQETVLYDLLILLSGPEPQRTILENKLLEIIPQRKERILLVRGLANTEKQISGFNNAEIVNYLHADALSQKLAQSRFVLARSGYTTVMEMIDLQKKCIYIPTPGQTEQEYLAKKLHQQKWAFSFEQSEENYNEKIDEALEVMRQCVN